MWVCRLTPFNERDRALLSDEERARAERLVAPQARERYLASHVTARRILGTALGTSPGAVRVATLSSGKPYLPDFSGIHFSLSHSADLVAVAVTSAGPVGIDIEVQQDVDIPAIASGYFGADEADAILSTESESARAFFRCWTRKEAFLKATGEGLARSLKSFSVSVRTEDRFTIVEHSRTQGYQGVPVLRRSFGEAGIWTGAVVAIVPADK